jgi:hypothetical protein
MISNSKQFESRLSPERHKQSVEIRKQTPISPVLRKSLDSFEHYDTEEEIIADIEAFGFIRNLDKKIRTGEYVFTSPKTKKTYTTHTTGYVRVTIPAENYRGTEIIHLAPLTREFLHDLKDRLKLILRKAAKEYDDKNIIKYWKRSDLSFKDFLHTKSGNTLTSIYKYRLH